LVGTVMSAVVGGVSVPGDVGAYVRLAVVPLRNAVASATAFSGEPAKYENGAATLFASDVCPDDAVEVVVTVVVSAPIAVDAMLEPASATAAIAIHVFRLRIVIFRSFKNA